MSCFSCYLWIILKSSGHLEYDDPIVEVRVEIVHSGPNSKAVHPVPVHLHINGFLEIDPQIFKMQNSTLIKKIKFSAYIRKFRMEQLQSRIRLIDYRPPQIWGSICAFPHKLGGPSS